MQKHIIKMNEEARAALRTLDILQGFVSKTLFVVDDQNRLVGSLTDGDIRRGLLNGCEISQPTSAFMNTDYKYLADSQGSMEIITGYRKLGIQLVPLIDENRRLIDILDLRKTKTILPVTALIMAGGRGERLSPFTDTCPKPMLRVGGKPIIEHNVDRLITYGVRDIFISVKYLKEQIMDYFGDGSSKGINIRYIEEEEPLGTLGALSLLEEGRFADYLVMNSDLLTTIDFEDFFNFFKDSEAGMALASIPYNVNVPYAVLETVGKKVSAFSEKPTYTYYSNGGIYLITSELKRQVPKRVFYNATDLMDQLINSKRFQLVHYPLLTYWLDIGKHQDFIKAQEDIKHIDLAWHQGRL